MKKIISLLLLLSLSAYAGLPPTTSKGSGDSTGVTTFNYQFPNFAITHTGVTASLGILGTAGGGTGNSTGTATNGTTASTSANASFFPLFAASSSNGSQPFNLGTGLTFNPSTNTLSTTTFVGSLTGNASLDLPLAGGTLTGAVSDTTAGALSTPAFSFSGSPVTGGSATTTKPLFLLEDAATSTGWSTSGTYLGINGKTGFTGNLFDLQNNGVTKLNVDLSGNLTGFGTLSYDTVTSQGTNHVLTLGSRNQSTAGNFGVSMATGTYSQTSGANGGVKITPTYNQASGNSANTDLLINRTETAIGSGTQNLIDAQVATVSKFAVDRTGQITAPLYNAAGVLTNNASGVIASVAPSTNGNVLTSNGSAWVSSVAAVANDPSQQNNLGFAATASTTLVVALKQADGSTDPAAGSGAVNVGFRSATTTSGGYALKAFTAANSITLAAADSLGCTASAACTLYVYLVSDTTSEVCLSFTQFDERVVQSASALTAGADTSGSTLWCTSAHTSKPIRLIGKMTATWSNPNWGTLASPVSIVKGNDSNVASFDPGLWNVQALSVFTTCSADPCTISVGGTKWATANRNSVGNYTINIKTGVFSAAPTCTITPGNTGNLFGVRQLADPTTTAVNFGMATIANGGAVATADGSFHVICVGAR